MLFEYVKRLALPLDVFPAVQRLNSILRFDFKFEDFAGSRRKPTSHPEAQLMALLLVTTKLLFPFDTDSTPQHSQAHGDPAVPIIEWDSWVRAHKIFEGCGNDECKLRKGEEIQVQDQDVFGMSGMELDKYMDWYQKLWIKSDKMDEGINKELLAMFPLKDLPSSSSTQEEETAFENAIADKVRHLIRESSTISCVIGGDAVKYDAKMARPGADYQRAGDLNSLSPNAKAFYECAAKVACLSPRSLALALAQTERKIILWKRAKRRAATFGDEMNLEAEDYLTASIGRMEKMSLGAAQFPDQEDTSERGSGVDMNMIG